MKAFERPNLAGGWKCPICGTTKIEEVVLIGIEGTQEGQNMQAEQFHLRCIDLTYFKKLNTIAMKFKNNGKEQDE